MGCHMAATRGKGGGKPGATGNKRALVVGPKRAGVTRMPARKTAVASRPDVGTRQEGVALDGTPLLETWRRKRGDIGKVVIATLDMEAANPLELADQVKEGIPASKFDLFRQRTGLPAERIRALTHIPERTLARRRSQGGRLTQQESESLVRLAKVYDKAMDLFEGDQEAALAWLDAPNRALAHRPPLQVAETEIGAREVEALIGRLEHGVFS